MLDFDRFFEHLSQFDVPDIGDRMAEIVKGLDVLEQHPEIGRPAGGGLRELVLGRDSRGYVALYEYIESLDTVYVIAIRSQREAGYVR
jgi:toxin ParE1/3/4